MTLTIYSKNNCPYCEQAKNFLKLKNINFNEINVAHDEEAKKFITEQGHRTVPQIYFDGKLFVEGGWQGLSKMTAEQIFNEISLRKSLTNQKL